MLAPSHNLCDLAGSAVARGLASGDCPKTFPMVLALSRCTGDAEYQQLREYRRRCVRPAGGALAGARKRARRR